MPIYLDYSATTPCRPEAIAKVQEVLEHQWGNPSSVHHWGERAALTLEEARIQVGQLINAPAERLVFTSGGTESNNIAILGATATSSTPKHLIISAVEHSAVSQPAKILQRQGWDISILPVNAQGRVDPKMLRQMIRENTALISIIYGQSEVGTIQPIQDLGAVAREKGIIFHTDAVQAVGRIPIDVAQSPVDMLSMSSHKIYGPQGAGALYIRSGLDIQAVIHGGGQEQSLRPGTQALPAIAGFGVAAEYAHGELDAECERLTQLRELLFESVSDELRLVPTGDRMNRLPHHVSFCIKPGPDSTLKGRDLVRLMSRKGIGISAGSACNSGKSVPSSVLKSMGYSDEIAQGGVRLTLGKQTQKDDVVQVSQVLKQVIAEKLG